MWPTPQEKTHGRYCRSGQGLWLWGLLSPELNLISQYSIKLLSKFLSTHKLVQLPDLITEDSLCSGLWLTQKLTTGPISSDCERTAVLMNSHLEMPLQDLHKIKLVSTPAHREGRFVNLVLFNVSLTQAIVI